MKYLIGTNIKMYRTWLEANQWLSDMNRDVRESSLVEVALFPPFFSLVGASERISKKNIGFGPQNMSWEERGAYTGEVSPLMLKELGCRYVELGHHERRLYFNETDQRVNQKAALALAHGLRPLICVGEDSEFKHQGFEDFLARQLNTILEGLRFNDPADLIIGYEPRWAIGQAEAAGIEHIGRSCDLARERLRHFFKNLGDEVRVIYGGSVKLADAPAMLAHPNISGLFIGRAALDTSSFAQVVELAHQLAQANKEA